MIHKLLLGLVAVFFSVSLAHAQAVVKPCVESSNSSSGITSYNCQPVSVANPMPVSGAFSAAGFTPGLTYATLTATNVSASVALPAGTVVAFQNTGTTTVSCTLGVGAATALANQIQIAASSTVFVTVGSNTFGACIDQTGSASNQVVLAGGSGLGTGFGGGGGGGGGSAVNTWATVALGSTAVVNYGATPPAAPVPAVNAFITNVNPNGQQTKINSASTVIATGQVFAGQNQPGGIDGLLTGCQFNTTPTTIVSGNVSPLECDNAGNLLTLAKQGPAGASAWLVTGAGGTFPVTGTVSTTPPANASSNVAQINGVTPLMGNGVSGTGSLRVNIASDNSAVANNLTQQNGVALSATAPLFAGISQGGNTAVVKPSSVGAAATDPALAVTMSPNSASLNVVPSNNTNAAAIPLAAQTVSGASADLSNFSGSGVIASIRVTAVSGTTPSMVVSIQGKDVTSGVYYNILSSAPITVANGAGQVTLLKVFPGATASANAYANDIIPSTFRIAYTITGTTPSFTFSVDASTVE